MAATTIGNWPPAWYFADVSLSEAIQFLNAGNLAQAEAACRLHVGANPIDPKGLHLLGSIRLRRGYPAEAVELLIRAVRSSPQTPHLRVDLAAALGAIGKHADALSHLLEALKVTGNIAELHNNLGVTLEALERIVEAEAAYRTAIRLKRDYPEAHHNLGNALRKLGDFAQAAASYREALRLRPNYAKVYDGLAACHAELGELDETIACYRRMMELDPTNPGARSALLYSLHYHPNYGPPEHFHEASEWGRRFCEPLKSQIRPHENDRSPDRKLRIGYFSPDFREHTPPKFITAALQYHDREGFEIFCYSDVTTAQEDAITARLKMLVENWRNTAAMSDTDLEKLIRDDRIDILVDLRGHAAGNRMPLFARKPAPVQVNMVGYFDTTGLSAIDYRITDEWMDPPGQTEQYYVEKLVRLPHTCWCYTADDDSPEVSEPPAIRNGYVTFGSLSKIIKITPACAAMWAGVLKAVPTSRLLLAAASDTADEVLSRLARIGLPPERIQIAAKTRSRREYLERYDQIDIVLDTFPFNGITTTCDGLWMGVPHVSVAGNTSVSRAGKSILRAADLCELAAEIPEAFVRVTTALANDRDRLRELRLGMRDRLLKSALMNHLAFAANLDAAYRRMWQVWSSQR